MTANKLADCEMIIVLVVRCKGRKQKYQVINRLKLIANIEILTSNLNKFCSTACLK